MFTYIKVKIFPIQKEKPWDFVSLDRTNSAGSANGPPSDATERQLLKSVWFKRLNKQTHYCTALIVVSAPALIMVLIGYTPSL